MDKEQKLRLINTIFSPSAPIENADLFVGRELQIMQISEAIEQRGLHAVMFGSRGVGKTSLANILGDLLDNVFISKITCNRNDTFNTIWEKAFRKVKYVEKERTVGFKPTEREHVVQLMLPENIQIDPMHIEEAFKDMNDHFLFIFDEFDSITSADTQIKMADTMKALSDNVPNVTLLIIGIAESVSQLIGDHPSLERCIKQIQMPIMSDEEAEKIIESIGVVSLEIDETVVNKIVAYASGFPHYVHLLCRYAASITVVNDSDFILPEYFDWAVLQSIENSNQSIRTAYERATVSSRKKTQFEDVILACALTRADEKSCFGAEEVLEKYNSLTHKQAAKESLHYNLGMLCKDERGSILEKITEKQSVKYRFRNPLMKAFAKLKLHGVDLSLVVTDEKV